MREFCRCGSISIGLFLCLMIGSNIACAQTSEDPFRLDLGTKFGRISDPKVEKDEGNELIAVRRTVLLFENPALKIRQREFVEIQLKAKYPLSGGMNCCEPFGFIGGKSFPVYRAGRYSLVRMERADFNKLKDGSIIFLAYISIGSIGFLAEKSESNDFRDIAGEKFGKLQKKDSKRFPVIRETQDEFNARIRRITLER